MAALCHSNVSVLRAGKVCMLQQALSAGLKGLGCTPFLAAQLAQSAASPLLFCDNAEAPLQLALSESHFVSEVAACNESCQSCAKYQDKLQMLIHCYIAGPCLVANEVDCLSVPACLH